MSRNTRTSSRSGQPTSAGSSGGPPLSGCKNMRAKSLTVVAVGLLMTFGFFAFPESALLIIGICTAVFGVSLLFLDYIVRYNKFDARPPSTRSRTNRSRRTTRNRNRHRQVSSVTSTTSSSLPTSTSNGGQTLDPNVDPNDVGIWACPSSMQWPYLPAEPPPAYSPPTTTNTDEHSPETVVDMDGVLPDPIFYPINRYRYESTAPLPSYEEVITSGVRRHNDVLSSSSASSTSTSLTTDTIANTSTAGSTTTEVTTTTSTIIITATSTAVKPDDS